MKIVNYKLKIIKTLSLLSITLLVIIVLLPHPVEARSYNCNESQDNPATPEDDTESCTGIVPCYGIDCSLCDIFSLVQNIFNFFVWTLVPILATGLVLWSGFDILTAGGNSNKAGAGRKRLTATLIGIAIIYSSYILASFVVKFLAGDNSVAGSSFKNGQFEIACSGGEIQDVTGTYMQNGSFSFKVGEDLAVDEKPVEIVKEDVGGSVLVPGVEVANDEVDLAGLRTNVKTALKSAAENANSLGIELLVTDGARSVDYQMSLAEKNCEEGPLESGRCVPKPNRPETCVPKGDGSNCRHVRGQAVDAWCWNSQTGSKCNQNSLISIMKEKGFCVYNKESWHFELKENLQQNPDRRSVFSCN